jgi:hypothetical protein
MKLTNVKRIIVEDFDKNQQDTISKLGYIINTVFEQLVTILNNQVTVTDNLNESIQQLSVNVDSTGTPSQATTIKYNLAGKCQGVSVISATNTTSSSVYPTACPLILFTQNSNTTLTVNKVLGLPANNNFTLTVRVTGT